MAISDQEAGDHHHQLSNAERTNFHRIKESPTTTANQTSGQPSAPLLTRRSSWAESFTLWKQRSFRQNNNTGDHENRRNDRRYKAPSGPPPPPPPRRRPPSPESHHEYATTGPPTYGLLSSSAGSKSGHAKSSFAYNETSSSKRQTCSSSHRSGSAGVCPMSKRIDFKTVAIALGILCLLLLAMVVALFTYLLSGRLQVEPGELSITETMSGHASPSSLIFYDDFDSLNLTTWRHDRYISNDGFVIYGSSKNNSYVENGILYIEPTFTLDEFDYGFLMKGTMKIGTTVEQAEGCSSFLRTECEKTAKGYENYSIINPVLSATLKTSQSFTFQYGIIEMRAKMPKGDWISTEISLLPRFSYYGEPALNTEKITLITIKGNSDYVSYSNRTNYGNERVCSQLIYTEPESVGGGGGGQTVSELCTNTEPRKGYGEEFHTYKYIWDKAFLKIFIDDKMAGRFMVVEDTFIRSNARHIAVQGGDSDEEENTKRVSFDQQFYIQVKLSVAEGFADSGFRAAYTKPWINDPLNTGQGPYRFWANRNRWMPSWQNKSSALQIDYIRVKAL